MTIELTKILSTNTPESPFDNEQNWQASMARLISIRLLNAAEADGMGGCKLCQS